MYSTATQRPTLAAVLSHPSSTFDSNATLLHRLQSGQIYSIPENCQSGLIILKSFYADFAGPGAAIGGEFDRCCTAVYAIESTHLENQTSLAAREHSLQTRIAYAEKLAAITRIAAPLHRGSLIVQHLSQWLSAERAMTIPYELIGKLVGISPITVKLAWQSRQKRPDEMPTVIAPARMV